MDKKVEVINCDDIISLRKRKWLEDEDIDLDNELIKAIADKLISNSDEGKALREEIQANPEKLIEMCFIIVDKNSRSMPFFLNESQRILINIINQGIKEYAEGKRNHLKYLLLKGRQAGQTSFITAYQLAKSITTRNFSGVTIADNGDNTTTIFVDKARYTFSQLPEVLKPQEQYSSKREMVFDKINSKWRCLNAGAKEIGRSKTITFWHGSEGAFYPDLDNLMKALGQALTKDSIQIIETTANGFNQFRTLWGEAVNGENNWTPIFLEWWRTKEYRLDFENKHKEEEFKDFVFSGKSEIANKLRWLIEDKKLDYDQVYWYYSKYKDLKEGVMQEYPCTPDEAFLTSGNPIFDNEKILKRYDYLENLYKTHKPIKGKFVYKYVNERIVDNSIKFIEDDNGYITIYEKPMNFYPYVIGGDTAEGGEDYCIGQVLNNRSGKQVATFRARMDTDLYAKQMYCLGKYYNNALLGVEMNFDLHPIKELSRLGYRNQYMRETMDSITGAIQNKAGFNTNRATRPIIIGDLITIVRESIHLINDITTLKEMLTFIDNNGKAEAIDGEHDDTVLALAIAFNIRSQQRTTLEAIEEEEKKLPHMFLEEEEKDFDDYF